MAYYSQTELEALGFKKLGRNVKVSQSASIYDFGKIEIGDNSRIDDFCVVSGKLVIGCNVHVTPQCLIAGGEEGIVLEDYTTLAYGVKVFSQSDDYSGDTMTNSLIPKQYKNEFKKRVVIEKYSIVGASAVIMPGIYVKEGSSIGAMSLVTKDTDEWSINVGCPSKKIKNRSKKMLDLVSLYESELEKNNE